jgi:hypothetical protein
MATSFELAGAESDHLKRQAEAADSARLESRVRDAAPMSDRPADMKMVELDRIGPTDLGPADSPGEAQERAGLRREAEMLKQMQPALEQGANADAFASWDKANGIGHYSFERYDRYVRGYEDVYHSYCGPDAVAVEFKPDGGCNVLNGRHRIEAAREVGLKKIPARIIG